jgi:signal transduction histidine kinase
VTATTAAGEEPVSGRWRIAWHGFFYLVLAYATGAALALGQGSGSAGAAAARLALAAALGAWYWLWLLGPRRRDPRATQRYLLGAAALWVALMMVDPDFLVLGLAIFAPFCLHHVGWALAATVLVFAGAVWQLLTQHQELSWPAVAAVLLVGASSLLAVGSVGAMVRQSRQRQRLIEQLEATRAELAAAGRHAGMLAERQRLARDLHDTLTQGFASVVMLLEAAQESLALGRPVDRHIEQALLSARDNLAESRRVVWALRPRPLAERSLPQALEELAGRLAEESGLRTEAVVTGTVQPLAAQVEEALLRVSQEALANARKHAGASRVTLTLSFLDDAVTLDVQDDGAGFDPDAVAAGDGGLGLAAMRERVAALGGSLAVESAPGEGTTVAAEVPISTGRGGPR